MDIFGKDFMGCRTVVAFHHHGKIPGFQQGQQGPEVVIPVRERGMVLRAHPVADVELGNPGKGAVECFHFFRAVTVG